MKEKAQTFSAKQVSYNSKIKLVKRVLRNMTDARRHSTSSRLLLTGDPGTGKTSFVEMLSNLLGLPLVLVEAPHVSQEHLINLPFLTFDPITNTHSSGSDKFEETSSGDFKVVLAKSFLHSELGSRQKISNEQYLKHTETFNSDLKAIFEGLKYSNKSLDYEDDEIPELIKEVRAKYPVILFLDEFFRQQDVKIKNIIRGFLNGKIGNNTIPADTYMIYASNMNDSGVTPQLKNEDFKHIKYDSPNKEEWFGYMVAKYSDEKDVKLKKEVVDVFYNVITQDNLSFNDEDSGVRMSPRRWTQLMLYVNDNIPCKSQQDAEMLMHNVEINMQNYSTGDLSSVALDVKKAVADLIKQTSGFTVYAQERADQTKWKDALAQQIKTLMSLGEYRKYVPVVAGFPGMAKTSHMRSIANELNLDFIDIDVASINLSDLAGISIPKEQLEQNTLISFHKPPLLIQIENQINNAMLSRKEGEGYLGKYKHLIFFDNLSHSNFALSNAIIKILIDKEFTKGYRLPRDAVLVCALTPEAQGTEFLYYFRDVLDISVVKPSWRDVVKQWKNIEPKGSKDPMYDDTKQLVISAIIEFANTFKIPYKLANKKGISPKETQFYLSLSNNTEDYMYMSPREYSDIVLEAISSLNDERQVFRRKIANEIIDISNPANSGKIEQSLRQDFADIMVSTLLSVENKEFSETLEDLNTAVEDWIVGSMKASLAGSLTYIESKLDEEATIENIVKKYLNENVNTADILNDTMVARYVEDARYNPNHFVEVLSNAINEKYGSGLGLLKHSLYDVNEDYKYFDIPSNSFKTMENAKACHFENFMNAMLAMFFKFGVGGREYLSRLGEVFGDLTNNLISPQSNSMEELIIEQFIEKIAKEENLSGVMTAKQFSEIKLCPKMNSFSFTKNEYCREFINSGILISKQNNSFFSSKIPTPAKQSYSFLYTQGFHPCITHYNGISRIISKTIELSMITS